MFDAKRFEQKLEKTMGNIAEEFAKQAVPIIEQDIQDRLIQQIGYDGQKMPKKKQPRRSRNPKIFLKDTGESMKLDIRKINRTTYEISARRPEILTQPNPWKGLSIFWGVPKALERELRKLANSIIKLELRKVK